jgi:hypothetical protein
VVALALLAVAPAAAGANSLLSGYGGPGQGSQVILGSALVNPPGGGSGGGGGSSSSGGGSGPQARTPNHGASSPEGPAGARNRGSGPHSAPSASKGGQASAGGAHGYTPALALAAHESGAGSAPFGLSGTDLLYILLVLGGLLLTGVVTMRVAGRPR